LPGQTVPPRPTLPTALYGGTFDPIHRGHIHAAEQVIAEGIAAQVIFLPAGQPWQKGNSLIGSAIERTAMVSTAIANNPRFHLSTREIERTGPTYTIDTVREYQGEFPAEDFILLMGSDTFNGIPTWKEFEEVLQSIDLVVALRPGDKLVQIPGAHFQIIESEMFDISSTEIRSAVHSHADLSNFVPISIANEVKRIYGA
jgi:nicotinate-nucleotide adenylyltransferase